MPQSFAEHLKAFPLSPNLGQSLERAHGFAREQAHRLVTLEHLLLALTEDPEAVIIMQAAGVDLARLTTDVSGHLGRLLEDMRAEPGTEPRPDPELLRVLQAAATAALQSKRRQIDGAIVLAAIVGDGKSPAAGLLKALGMTFEEAIRALQRANTKARLQPQTKPAPTAATTPASGPRPSFAPAGALAAPKPVVAAPAPTPIHVPQKLEPVLPAEELSTQQTAEEILAAARERIRQRAAAAKAERAAATSASQPAATAAPAPSSPAEPEPTPTSAPGAVEETKTLADAIGAAMTTPPAAAEPAQRAPQPAAAEAPQSRSTWAPRAEPPSSLVARLPSAPPRQYAAPPLARPIQPTEGPPRPPLPLRPGQGPVAKFPPPRTPWPEPPGGDPARGPRLPNGSLPGPKPPPTGGFGQPPSPWPATPPQALRAGQGERGPLVENVPRVMRVGTPALVEVHIARDKIESLIVALSARGATAFRPDGFIARAVTVRLSAPHGGFWIEAESPETQWAESTSSKPHDDHAVWRWTVLPHRGGRARLLLTVETRTVGRDGLATESAPPDRVIEVRVKSNKLRGLGRLLGWIVLVAIGMTVGYFMRSELTAVLTTVRNLIGI